MLFYRHRLRGLQACEGRAVATTEMVSRKIWSGDQYRLASLPDTHLVLRFLAAGNSRRTQYYELGGTDVWCGDCLGIGILCGLGKTFLRWSGHDREAGFVQLDLKIPCIHKHNSMLWPWKAKLGSPRCGIARLSAKVIVQHT